jgi:CheY-like chemotaxis protein
MPAILFVDDNEEILTLGKLFLEGSGTMTVDTAASATMAIGKLNRGKYDAILSDYNMPVMNGIEFPAVRPECVRGYPVYHVHM